MDESAAYTFLNGGFGVAGGDPTGLGSVCARCAELLEVDGAAVALFGPGRRETLCVSGEGVQVIEEWQFTFDEGPCVDAYRSLHPTVGTTGRRSRWPELAAKAADMGVRSMAGFPLTNSGDPWGALDVYRRTTAVFDDEWIEGSASVAAAMSNVVLDRLSFDPTSPTVATGRSEVHQATGIVSSTLGIRVDDALAVLRARAIAEDRMLILLAREVVTGSVRFDR